MSKASAPELRKCLMLAKELVSSGISFIPIPIINDEDELIIELQKRLNIIENESYKQEK